MAGIGFELRRIAARGDLSGFAQAYLGAAIVVAGPWLFTVGALLAIGLAGPWVDAQEMFRFRLVTNYNFAASLILAGPLGLVANRYLADRLHARDAAAVPGALLGICAAHLAIAGAAGIPFWLVAGELTQMQRLLAIAQLLLCAGIWSAASFLTLLRRHSALNRSFAVAMALGVVSSGLLAGRYAATGLLAGFDVALAMLLAMLLARILSELPFPVLRPFGFLGTMRSYRELAWAGAAYSLGIWVDKIALWFAPEASAQGPLLRSFPAYEGAMFLSNLLLVPGLAVFLVQFETSYYERIRAWFRAIGSGANLAEIALHHRDVVVTVRRGLLHVGTIQALVCLAAFAIAPWAAPQMGVGHAGMAMLRLGSLGALFHLLLLVMISLLAYLDQRAALVRVSLAFLAGNFAFTLASLGLGFSWYGAGYLLACVAATIVAYAELERAVLRLPYFTFIGNNPAVRCG